LAKRLLFDPELVRFVPNLGVLWSVDTKSQKSIRNVDELAADLGNQKELEELILFFHGFPGGIRLGNKEFGLSDANLRKAFTKKTKINTIRFEGCWVGERPDEMAQFGTIFGASRVFGFTWEGVRNLVKLNIPQGANPDTVTKLLKPFERWLADRSPSAREIADQAKTRAITKELLLEWWQIIVLGSPAPYDTPKGSTKTNYEKFGSHSYKRRDDAQDTTLKAKDLEETSLEPISNFEYVQVTS
jgi:hypothetical protein